MLRIRNIHAAAIRQKPRRALLRGPVDNILMP